MAAGWPSSPEESPRPRLITRLGYAAFFLLWRLWSFVLPLLTHPSNGHVAHLVSVKIEHWDVPPSGKYTLGYGVKSLTNTIVFSFYFGN